MVHILFNDPGLIAWTPGDTVDHVSRKKFDNRASNLRWANRKEQRDNQKIRQCKKRISAVRLCKDGECHEFESLLDAGAFIGAHPSNLSRQKTVKGWTVEKLEQPDFEGEKWAEVNQYTKVSNFGRVWTFGTKMFPKAKRSGYVMYRNINVARWVLELFVGPPPSKSHTADHIDRIRCNNHVDNLRWASKEEQCANQSQHKTRKLQKVEARALSSSEWTVFESSIAAIKALGLNPTRVKHALDPSRRRPTAKGIDGVEYELRRVVDEDQMTFKGEVWKDVDVDEWIEGGVYYKIDERPRVPP